MTGVRFRSEVFEETERDHGVDVEGHRAGKRVGLDTPAIGFMRQSTVFSETRVSPVYVVLGIFSKEDGLPYEEIVFVPDPRRLFWKLQLAVLHLRGLSSFFSLRSIKAFRLYKVRGPHRFLFSFL